MTAHPETNRPFEIAVVVPVHNESENIRPLIEEISAALDGVANYEIVYVNDGSTDDTAEKLAEMAAEQPRLSVYKHETACGQSAAVATGVKRARATYIATLDGDGQNDPADIPALFARLKEAQDPDYLLVAGWRAKRKDTEWKRFQSKLANAVRQKLLGDNTPDTGCGLKVFTRAAFLDMPRFDHMHRYLPALMIRRGGAVVSVEVNHRHRERGISKYGMWDRLSVAVRDVLGVMWLTARGSKPRVSAVRQAKSE
ncbi:glycosyltransferase family 2 protein [Magnetovibrio sp.]|uniref:glycosyltransferase family 2 protein n=1 Tax=Magnetovibrio sp. TaxID=2024836 RepID=UPI002F946CA2